jgi:hypothetical protein
VLLKPRPVALDLGERVQVAQAFQHGPQLRILTALDRLAEQLISSSSTEPSQSSCEQNTGGTAGAGAP